MLLLQVDIDLCVQEVAPLFGLYVKYKLDDPKDLVFPSRNASEVLLASQQELSQPKLPSSIEVRNNKYRLYNSVLCLLERKELTCRWRSDTVSTYRTHLSGR